MAGVREEADALVIGAMTTHYQVMRSRLVRQHCGLLAEATSTVADPQVRHRGTLGGALCHADPAGDLPAVVLTCDATLVAHGANGTRAIPAREFFVDYMQTAVAADEILVEIRFPKLDAGWGYHYEKFQRVAQAWAVVGVAALVRRGVEGRVAEARLGLVNMGPTPLRASAVEAALLGVEASEVEVGDAAARAADGTRPPSDLSGGSDYRQHLARVLTSRAVMAAVGN
jgi:carbon-monoxide dehydrogenase medium subunit